jgi:drug/metabolite transporter (DMT)-like permease
MALESFPPLLLVASRFLVSGSIMLAFAAMRGLHIPRGRELRIACVSGVLILWVGNGMLVLAEMLMASGMAGLILTISPFWMVGIEAALPGGERLHIPTILGMVVGLGGAALLFQPDAATHAFNRHLLIGLLLLQVGMASWSFGSIYQRRNAGRAHPIVAGAVQQLAAGVAMTPFALLIPEHAVQWSWRGGAAIVYLVVFGSIVGYSAYVYALDRLPVAIVSVYPYVNAMVAVTLGWLFYREPFGLREALAMTVIFSGVAIVKWSTRGFAGRA